MFVVERNIFMFEGTVILISSDPSCKDDNVRFTMTLSVKVCKELDIPCVYFLLFRSNGEIRI